MPILRVRAHTDHIWGYEHCVKVVAAWVVPVHMVWFVLNIVATET